MVHLIEWYFPLGWKPNGMFIYIFPEGYVLSGSCVLIKELPCGSSYEERTPNQWLYPYENHNAKYLIQLIIHNLEQSCDKKVQ